MFLDRRPDERGEPAQSRPLEPQDDETQRLDEADQLYVDLNTLTGYGSYLEYFNAHQELTRELIQFCKLDTCIQR